MKFVGLVPSEVAINAHFARLARVKDPSKAVLGLDYDGPTAPMNVNPLQAYPYREMPELIDEVIETGTRVVMVSGRPVFELMQLLLLKNPFEIYGGHGAEYRAKDGTVTKVTIELTKLHALNVVERWMPKVEKLGVGGVMYERKYASVAVHWRRLYEAGEHATIAAVEKFMEDRWRELNRRDLLRKDPFECGTEIRAKGWDKGKVIKELTEHAEVGTYIGDDVTDEDAFRAVKYNDALKEKVLTVHARPVPKKSDAAAYLIPPEGMIQFFSRWIEVMNGREVNRVVFLPSNLKVRVA